MWKIAIIDDDRQILKVMKHVIPWDGLNATCVGEAIDGKEGLRLIEKEEPDIILTDIYMPVMSGLEMIEKLRDQGYKGKIIILSGYSDFENARQALRLQVDDYLSKPITVNTIMEVFQRVILKLEQSLKEKMELENLERKLLLYQPLAIQEWMKSLATGMDSSLSEQKEIISYMDQWKRQSHIVLGIKMDMEYLEETKDVVAWRTFDFEISHLINELKGIKFQNAHYLRLQIHFSIVLIHFEENMDKNNALNNAKELGKKIIDYFLEVYGLNLFVGIGRLKKGIDHLSESTEEAFYAISNRKLYPITHCPLYEYQSINQLEKFKIKPIKFYQELTDAMRHSEKERALNIINEFMCNIYDHNEEITPALLQYLGLEIWAIFSYSLYDVGINLEDIKSKAAIQKEMEDIISIVDLEKWLKDKVEIILNNGQWNENLKHKQVIDFMIQYINEHYSENITITKLTNKVFISRNYLSQIFKNATGVSFNQYLNKVRMEKAKSLILEGKYLVYEISEMVGFKNTAYFSTLFKKYTGFTPTELIHQ